MLYKVTREDAITFYKREIECVDTYMEAHKGDIPYQLEITHQCHALALEALMKCNKTAEWKKISSAGIYECPVCGQNVMTSDISCYKFCHGCGIRMEAENVTSI